MSLRYISIILPKRMHLSHRGVSFSIPH